MLDTKLIGIAVALGSGLMVGIQATFLHSLDERSALPRPVSFSMCLEEFLPGQSC